MFVGLFLTEAAGKRSCGRHIESDYSPGVEVVTLLGARSEWTTVTVKQDARLLTVRSRLAIVSSHCGQRSRLLIDDGVRKASFVEHVRCGVIRGWCQLGDSTANEPSCPK